MGRIAGEIKNAISVDPEETPNLTRQVLIYGGMLAGLMLAGCTQHNTAADLVAPTPARVRAYEGAPDHHVVAAAEPAILGLAEEQDIESLRLARCQTNKTCK
ncbi:hypothetical protein [Paenochrobactrum glaciei]|uniref:Lipoprotein n=1 Tax=Paenochrobactrum glaciei TaxID=486407 RepID=A0ABP3QY05_9HYPH